MCVSDTRLLYLGFSYSGSLLASEAGLEPGALSTLEVPEVVSVTSANSPTGLAALHCDHLGVLFTFLAPSVFLSPRALTCWTTIPSELGKLEPARSELRVTGKASLSKHEAFTGRNTSFRGAIVA